MSANPFDTWLEEDGLRFMPRNCSASIRLVSFVHERFGEFLDGADFQYAVLPNNLLEIGRRVHFVTGELEQIETSVVN